MFDCAEVHISFLLFPPPPASSMLVKASKFNRFNYINALILFLQVHIVYVQSIMFLRLQLKIYLRHQLIQDLPGRSRRGAVLLYNVMKKLAICYRLQDPTSAGF